MAKEKIIQLGNSTSTNDYLLDNARQFAGDDLVVAQADFQSCGHGMGTNQWESEAGKNLLFSFLIHPTWIDPSIQFLISMVQAISVREVLSEYADDITIKWPNDIYWKDKKISGTRIDGNIKGMEMTDMVIGTGININQKEFRSDAPNPVSLYQITGKEHDCNEILAKIIERFKHYIAIAENEWGCHVCETTMDEYHKYVYRKKGFHLYEDEDGLFEAELLDVHPNGIMQLVDRTGMLRQYEYKEVKFILPSES